MPGIGAVAIGINELQDSGVMFCVCNMAMTVYSAVIAKMNNLKAEDVYNDFKAGVFLTSRSFPPAYGLWAVRRNTDAVIALPDKTMKSEGRLMNK